MQFVAVIFSRAYMKILVALVGIGLLMVSSGRADYYASMSLSPSTVHINCKNIDEDVFVVGDCNNTSFGSPLHFQADCEINAVGQTTQREWEWEGIIQLTHAVPSQFVSAQTFNLASDDSDVRLGLISHVLLHVTANSDGSFVATMDNLSLSCGS
jgi:hypothetical protein